VDDNSLQYLNISPRVPKSHILLTSRLDNTNIVKIYNKFMFLNSDMTSISVYFPILSNQFTCEDEESSVVD
jgi:hypothetical protein